MDAENLSPSKLKAMALFAAANGFTPQEITPVEDDGGDASIVEVAKVKKSRKRGVLAELNHSAYEERYAEKKTADSILRRGLTVGHGRARNKRAMKAVKATRPVTLPFSPPAAADDNKRSFDPDEAAEKRVAINLVFNHVLGSPPAEEWEGRGGVIAKICARLSIQPGPAPHRVKEVLE